MLRVCDFGDTLVPYMQALDLQQRLAEDCRESSGADTLLQLQVPSRIMPSTSVHYKHFNATCERILNERLVVCCY